MFGKCQHAQLEVQKLLGQSEQSGFSEIVAALIIGANCGFLRQLLLWQLLLVQLQLKLCQFFQHKTPFQRLIAATEIHCSLQLDTEECLLPLGIF